MTQVAVDIEGEVEEQVNLVRAINALASKEMAIQFMLNEYIKIKKINFDIELSKGEVKK